jgi:hypothetical protein
MLTDPYIGGNIQDALLVETGDEDYPFDKKNATADMQQQKREQETGNEATDEGEMSGWYALRVCPFRITHTTL